ncbi:isopenicillin N synthase family dioxygenase [Protofrankia symbiont of Coriaria ruscifolia]|uniref:isopenicillin N synthase family dioxygenase n=1 Tax=Protofrankia symbiont of Coriaria ruscifolia TaxID=1306542 RepID=UPI001040FC18|nr:2-oxoglutarate and iron-dependent oxygenase domain-containing protein [Protofrankia symbiont of Coriaria ruscifolia]
MTDRPDTVTSDTVTSDTVTSDTGRPGSAASETALPTLDIGPYRTGGPGREAFLAALRAACHGPGFFYLTGHGIPAATSAAVLEVSRRFFRLPEPVKLEIENIHSPHFRGYTRLGHEITRDNPDVREQIDISDERPARRLGPDDPPYLRLDGPNQWPAAFPQMPAIVQTYMAELGRLARTLVRAFAESLGLPAGHLDPTFAVEPRSHLKLIRYLPAPPDFAAGYDQGVGAHKDGGFITFVLQDDTGGLQVARSPAAGAGAQVARSPEAAAGAGAQAADGDWIDASPVPGTFVVNIGEMFELATQRYYRATVHRVVSPPAGTERVSVAFFFGPRLSATLAPLPLPEELRRQLPAVEPPDPRNPIFAEHGVNTLKSWLRSHPEVARRYYSEVEAPSGRGAY